MTSPLRRFLSRRVRTVRPRTSNTSEYPGDFAGIARSEYAPKINGRPDPGEIVWTWVTFEDDPTQGKDRPVLLIGHDSTSTALLGLALTSKDHHPGERRLHGSGEFPITVDSAGRHWFELGRGGWDNDGRPSEVRLDRVLRINPTQVRREGATLDRDRFDRVFASLKTVKGWR